MSSETPNTKTPLLRRPPNQGWRMANEMVSIEAAPPASRISLRATNEGATAFEVALGLTLPRKPGTSASRGGRHALWLGPDEWLVYDDMKPDTSMVPRLGSSKFAAIDISHRNTGFMATGSGAANTLNAGCPRDLSDSAFPVGCCSRTIFGKAEIVLHRVGEDAYRVECWRSFAPYVRELLTQGAKDAGL